MNWCRVCWAAWRSAVRALQADLAASQTVFAVASAVQGEESLWLDALQALRAGVADLTVVDFGARSPWGTAGHTIIGQSPDVLPRFVIPFLVAAVAGGEGHA